MTYGHVFVASTLLYSWHDSLTMFMIARIEYCVSKEIYIPTNISSVGANLLPHTLHFYIYFIIFILNATMALWSFSSGHLFLCTKYAFFNELSSAYRTMTTVFILCQFNFGTFTSICLYCSFWHNFIGVIRLAVSE